MKEYESISLKMSETVKNNWKRVNALLITICNLAVETKLDYYQRK